MAILSLSLLPPSPVPPLSPHLPPCVSHSVKTRTEACESILYCNVAKLVKWADFDSRGTGVSVDRKTVRLWIRDFEVALGVRKHYMYMFRGSSFFFGKVTALGVLRCFCLVVCLTLLASFFLPSHLSLKHVHVYIHMYMHVLCWCTCTECMCVVV